jgi:hypothetical protein
MSSQGYKLVKAGEGVLEHAISLLSLKASRDVVRVCGTRLETACLSGGSTQAFVGARLQRKGAWAAPYLHVVARKGRCFGGNAYIWLYLDAVGMDGGVVLITYQGRVVVEYPSSCRYTSSPATAIMENEVSSMKKKTSSHYPEEQF